MKQKSTDTRHTALVNGSSRSKNHPRRAHPYYAICIENSGNEVSLDLGKVYKVIKPHPRDGKMIRVIDNEGEDYLYSPRQFIPVEIPPRARRAVAAAAHFE